MERQRVIRVMRVIDETTIGLVLEGLLVGGLGRGDVAEALADAFEFTGAGAGFGDRVEAPGDSTTRAAKANRGTGGRASGASSSPLAALEKPLTAGLCAAGPRVAPAFAVVAAATFASYSLATFRRLARRAAGRRKNKTKAA